MTEQITLVCLWDSPQMKSCTTMQNIKGFTGKGIPRTTARINTWKRGATTQVHCICLLDPGKPLFESFSVMFFRYFAKYTNCAPTSKSGNYAVANYNKPAHFLSRERHLGEYLPSLGAFHKKHFRCFSSSAFLSPKSWWISRGAAISSAALPAAWLHDTKLPTNLILSEFPLFKMEIIIPSYTRGLFNVYTPL